MSNRKKRLLHKNVIGLDEMHNGFHLNSQFGINFPLTVTGYYLANYPGSQQANVKYERKRGVFVIHGGKSEEELEKRARYYFDIHPDFFYTVIPKEVLEAKSQRVRAEANALIILKFFLHYNLRQNNTVVEIGSINCRGESENIVYLTGEILKLAGLNLRVGYRNCGEKHNQAIKFADRVGYYIAGLKFRNPRAKWPCRNRKLDLGDLADIIIDQKLGLDETFEQD